MEVLSNLKKCNNERNKRKCLYDVLRSLDNKYHPKLALDYTQHTLDLLGEGLDIESLQDLIDTSYDVLEQKNNIAILWQKFSLFNQWDPTVQYSHLERLLRGLVDTAIKISCSKLAFDAELIANPPGKKPDIVDIAKDSSNLVGWWFSSNMGEKETKKKPDINFAWQEVEWQIKYTIDYLSEEVGK